MTGMRMAGMTGMRMGRRIAVATALACAAPSWGAELGLKALPDRLRPQDLCKPMASLGNVHYLEIVTNERDASCQLLLARMRIADWRASELLLTVSPP